MKNINIGQFIVLFLFILLSILVKAAGNNHNEKNVKYGNSHNSALTIARGKFRQRPIKFNSSGSNIAVSTFNPKKVIQIWDINKRKKTSELILPRNVIFFDFLDKNVFIGNKSYTLNKRHIVKESSNVLAISILRSYSAHKSKSTIRILNFRTNTEISLIKLPEKINYSKNLFAEFSSDGKYILIGIGKLYLYDTSTGKLIWQSKKAYISAKLSPNAHSIVAVHIPMKYDTLLYFLDIKERKSFQIKGVSLGATQHPCYVGDGQYIAFPSSKFNQITVWDSHKLKKVGTLPGRYVACQKSGNRIVATDNMTVTVWDTRKWQVVKKYRGFMGQKSKPFYAILSPNGKRLAINTRDAIYVWNLQN